MSKLKQFFCTHYHEVTSQGLPCYTLYPKKTIWPVGDYLRQAKNDWDAFTCLNCGMKYFDTTGRDELLDTPLDHKNDWFPGKPMLIMPKDRYEL